MSRLRLEDLRTVSQIRFLEEYRKISDLLAQEARLRDQLAQLERRALSAQSDSTHTMSLVGADILWQSWVSRSRRNLNMELAQILARKASAMADFRKAFGKREAVAEMLRLERDSDKRRQMRAFYEGLLQGG